MDPLLGLDPGLFIDRQHDRVDRWRQIQAAHVTDPVPELRVVTPVDPPADLGQVDVHRVQDPPHLRHGDVESVSAQRFSHLNTCPCGDRVVRLTCRGRGRGDADAFVVTEPARSPRPGKIVEAFQPVGEEPATPQSDLVLVHLNGRADLA
jgi:hypothetical protein